MAVGIMVRTFKSCDTKQQNPLVPPNVTMKCTVVVDYSVLPVNPLLLPFLQKKLNSPSNMYKNSSTFTQSSVMLEARLLLPFTRRPIWGVPQRTLRTLSNDSSSASSWLGLLCSPAHNHMKYLGFITGIPHISSISCTFHTAMSNLLAPKYMQDYRTHTSTRAICI
jgi:hypothetical protein